MYLTDFPFFLVAARQIKSEPALSDISHRNSLIISNNLADNYLERKWRWNMAYISHELGLHSLHRTSSDGSGDISYLCAGSAFRKVAQFEGNYSESLPRVLGLIYHSDAFGFWYLLHVLGGYIWR